MKKILYFFFPRTIDRMRAEEYYRGYNRGYFEGEHAAKVRTEKYASERDEK